MLEIVTNASAGSMVPIVLVFNSVYYPRTA